MKKKKEFPSYTVLKYYYNRGRSSRNFIYKNDRHPIGMLVLTEYGDIYFTASGGKPISIPDELRDECLYVYEWMNIREIEFCLKNQPFDFEENHVGHSMYSKKFWNTLLSDFRNSKIDFIVDKKEVLWTHY